MECVLGEAFVWPKQVGYSNTPRVPTMEERTMYNVLDSLERKVVCCLTATLLANPSICLFDKIHTPWILHFTIPSEPLVQ